VVEEGENDKHLVRPFIGVSPAIPPDRVEEVCHQTVRLTRHRIRFFEETGSLKLSQTFQFIKGQTGKKIED